MKNLLLSVLFIALFTISNSISAQRVLFLKLFGIIFGPQKASQQ